MFELAPFALSADYGESVLPLADVKAHCSIDADETYFDDLLGFFRDASVQMVEQYCGVFLAPRTDVVWRSESLRRPLRLSVGPITAITAFDYLDTTGAPFALAPDLLRFGLGGELLIKAGNTWPTDVGGGVEITFDAGFDDDTRPPTLVQAARMFTAHLFQNREAAVATGTMGGEMPLGFRQLCSAFRPGGI